MNTQITEDYVSFETAKLLKEKRFDVYGDGSFNSGIEIFAEYSPSGTLNKCITSKPHQKEYSAPTLQMAMKWLREVHKININILYDAQRFVKTDGTTEDVDVYEVDIITKNGIIYIGNYNHHESACEAAIKYCLENLMNK